MTDWILPRCWGGAMPEDGRNPSGHYHPEGKPLEVARNALWMEPSEVTIAEVLKGAGYRTGYIGKWHLGMDAYYPTSQGFDVNRGGCDYGQPPSYFDPFSNKQLDGIPHLEPREEGQYLTDREADEAIDFLIKKGFHEDYGARPLRRAIERHIEDPLAEKLLRGEFEDSSGIWADKATSDNSKDGEGLVFSPTEPSTPEPVASKTSIAAMTSPKASPSIANLGIWPSTWLLAMAVANLPAAGE